MDHFDSYKAVIIEKLEKIVENEKDSIRKAAELIVNTLLNDGRVYIFGCNHSAIIPQEVYYRAGSLAVYTPLLIPGLNLVNTKPVLSTFMERNEQFGKDIVLSSRIREKDVVIIVSTSGRNPVPVAFALEVKKIGSKIVVITSKKFCKSFPSRHSSGKTLLDIPPDVVIDNFADPGDVSVEVGNKKMGPVSTITGVFIIHLISMTVTDLMTKQGIDPPVFVSSNVPEGDRVNKKLSKEFEVFLKLP